jgi:hypothetical protein
MVANKGKRLTVNINDLRRALPDRAKSLIDNAGDEIVALQVNLELSGVDVITISVFFNFLEAHRRL